MKVLHRFTYPPYPCDGISDVDHTGLTNAELIKCKAKVAIEFDNRSVAEQKSIVLAWTVLMESRFGELRRCIFSTADERARFRQLIVNAVIATDIADKDLKAKREARWDSAFAGAVVCADTDMGRLDMDRRATVIFEYIIQASDISHCMQHWHTYQRFNARLFEERYVAWIEGHAEKSPALGWYGGEVWFFVSNMSRESLLPQV